MAEYLKAQLERITRDYCHAKTNWPFDLFAQAWIALYAEQYRAGNVLNFDMEEIRKTNV